MVHTPVLPADLAGKCCLHGQAWSPYPECQGSEPEPLFQSIYLPILLSSLNLSADSSHFHLLPNPLFISLSPRTEPWRTAAYLTAHSHWTQFTKGERGHWAERIASPRALSPSAADPPQDKLGAMEGQVPLCLPLRLAASLSRTTTHFRLPEMEDGGG